MIQSARVSRTRANASSWSCAATCPDAEYRDGAEAVTLASKVCELTKWKVKAYTSTLAAAHAESGDFARAVELAERFDDDNLDTFKAGKPVRESE